MRSLLILVLCLHVVLAQNGFQLETVFAHSADGLLYHSVDAIAAREIDTFPLANITVQDRRDAPFVWYSNGPLPNYNHRDVLYFFAAVSNVSYSPPDQVWIPTNSNLTVTYAADETRLHSYIFYSRQYNEVVIGFKGTDFFGSTANNDLAQDWLMFSCCGESASAVPFVGEPEPGCGCNNGQSCDVGCLYDCINQRNTYLREAIWIFNYARTQYPDAAFFFTGHSLGGAMAQMLTVAVGYPAVTFEAPPTLHYARAMGYRINGTVNTHLPIFGFGAFNDAIFMGGDACYPCAYAGSPIKTKCHLGYSCVWPLAQGIDYGWSMQTDAAHSINTVLPHVATLDIPTCYAYPDCADCAGWGYYV